MSSKFIEYLEELYENEDRGALAALRRGLGQEPGATASMFPHVVPYLRKIPPGSWSERAYFLVGALFALYPGSSEEHTSLGAALGQIWKETERDSIERRFLALLDAHPDDLAEHLRQAISLLRASNAKLDWELLLKHIEHWTHDDRWVQRAWAHDFWTSPRAQGGAPAGDGAQQGA